MRYRVFRPPYCYRWGVLILSVVTVTTFGVSAWRSPAESTPAPQPVGNAATVRETPARNTGEAVRDTARDGRFVALTFDDGPDPRYTPRVLDLLAKHDAVATFCMVGTEARRHPELVRAVVSAGMRLCDHTVTHDQRLRTRGERRITAEIVGGWTDLVLATGDDAPIDYFRAPGGNFSPRLNAVAARHGMRPLGWTVDTRDWTLPGAGRIVETVQQSVEPGSVILLHDGGGRRDQTIEALTRLLPWLAEQGYGFGFPG
ncbi:polysaccharide deacetylase family protein [Prauserella muralis]|uniref:Polysaccharide deacetylase n=1 Tax=Prauserella muralis TaxID=588067 RepID=A0A2V4AJJ0_9PSEU|nr:polysaccharide deacetylase family protein [Prauserella muralis]PXY19336.1 polysaccharide deacetylase [Prauserella muralis]TWE29290.1 peptidoglycan/xylan/chitin deacetylase (PgdA/CDA1 family) [Prauserella muralis]